MFVWPSRGAFLLAFSKESENNQRIDKQHAIKRSIMSQRPVVVGLLVCEQAVIEANSNNVSLINCFTRLKVERFPSEPRRFTVFAALIDGFGNIALDVVIYRLDTREEIYHQSRMALFQDRLQEVRFLFRVTQCAFPVSGKYEIVLQADGQALANHLISVVA